MSKNTKEYGNITKTYDTDRNVWVIKGMTETTLFSCLLWSTALDMLDNQGRFGMWLECVLNYIFKGVMQYHSNGAIDLVLEGKRVEIKSGGGSFTNDMKGNSKVIYCPRPYYEATIDTVELFVFNRKTFIDKGYELGCIRDNKTDKDGNPIVAINSNWKTSENCVCKSRSMKTIDRLMTYSIESFIVRELLD